MAEFESVEKYTDRPPGMTVEEYLDQYMGMCGIILIDLKERVEHTKTCRLCQESGPTSLCGRVFMNEDVLIDHYVGGCDECEELHAPNCQNQSAHQH